MPTILNSGMLQKALSDADEHGYRLEIIDGLGVWEVMPSKRHIDAEARIEKSIRPNPEAQSSECGCFTYRDLYVRFGEGSLRRPDISVFCREPVEQDEAVTMIPEAVIEIVSAGSERKDLELSPPFYLRFNVKDVVVLDPYSNIVWHHRAESVSRHQSPVEIPLECGCIVTV